MDFTTRYPIRSKSESENTRNTSSPEYQSDFKSHWSNKMYSTQNLNNSSKQHLLGGSTNENSKNYNLGKMYSTKQSLSMENMTNHPKKETFWQSAFKSATNLLNEHLNRSTGSIIKSWSSMNHPLSVTVVAPDLLKSLQQGKDHQLVNPSEGIFATKTWNKDSQSIDETLPNILYSNEFISDSAKKNSDPSDSDRRWKEYKNLYVDFTETQKKDLNQEEKIVNSVNNSDCHLEALESHFNFVVDKKDVDKSTNFGNTWNVDDDPVMLEKPDTLPVEVQQEKQQQLQNQHMENQSHTMEASLPMPVGTLLTNAYNKVVSGVTDLLQRRSNSQESCEPASLFTKRACTSPKLRSKRMHTVSVGRGRGRGKSQLRRSGVSQTRHRKERSRYNNAEDIKSDIDNWEALDYNPDDEAFEDVDVCDFAGKQPGDDKGNSSIHQYKNGSTFTLGDVKPKKRKPKKNKKCSWAQLSVACSVQSLDENGEIESSFDDKIKFRPRLLSESSVDSEDSYCIVFEDDGSSKTSDSESDYEDDDCETETDAETESEEEEESDSAMHVLDFESRPTKVHFDENPKIHHMVKWNYAYRTARRGPWEQMARDRDRFRTRILREGRTIEPVLRNEHRMRIWHERFEE